MEVEEKREIKVVLYMDKDVAISLNNVTMSFTLSKEKVDNLKEYMIKLITHKLEYNKFHALKNVSFEVKKGEHLAIMGLNGAGKSTLLKTIVGVYKPTEGTVEKNGVVAPLLELGAGFDPNYSGRENIYLYGAILGYDRDYIASKYDEIVEFSELGDFIEVPVKNYSSGMKARLGFSIATAVEPDILILDEVLSVGDAGFKKKSLAKVKSLFDNGVTVLFVSHSVNQVRAICDKGILLEHGEIIAQGDIENVIDVYESKTKPSVPEIDNGIYNLSNVRGLYSGWGAKKPRIRFEDADYPDKRFLCEKEGNAYLIPGAKIEIISTKMLPSGNLWAETPSGYLCIWQRNKNKLYIETQL